MHRLLYFHRLAKRMNAFINIYLILIFSLFYVAVSISIFVLISVADQGFVFIAKSLFYPIFASCVMITWCFIGQKLLNQVNNISLHLINWLIWILQTESLGYSLYKCKWSDAPRQFRKILFMFMIRCRRNVEIDAKPFYDVNISTFTDVRSVKSDKWASE